MLNNHGKLIIREKSAYVYEVQKVLVKNGIEISLDGIYESITINVIIEFEAKNNLFPDGNIDLLNLETLLK